MFAAALGRVALGSAAMFAAALGRVASRGEEGVSAKKLDLRIGGKLLNDFARAFAQNGS
jgi:hypothetical protein